MADWLGLIAVGIWGILIAGYVYAFFAIRKMVQQLQKENRQVTTLKKHWERKNKRHDYE